MLRKKNLCLFSLLLVTTFCHYAMQRDPFDSMCMDDVVDHFLGEHKNDRFQACIDDEVNDWRPAFYQRFSTSLHTVFSGNEPGHCDYGKSYDSVLHHDENTKINAGFSWSINKKGDLVVNDGIKKNRISDNGRRADTFAVRRIRRGQMWVSSSRLFSATYHRPFKSRSRWFIHSGVVPQERLDEKEWTYHPNLPLEATALCFALRERTNDGQDQAVAIADYHRVCSVVSSLPLKYRKKMVDSGWIKRPFSLWCLDWLRDNYIKLGVVGAISGMLLYKLKDSSK